MMLLCYLCFDKDWSSVFKMNAFLSPFRNYAGIVSQLKARQWYFPNKRVWPPWKQQIQLMDAHSLPHAYLDSAIATFG